MNRIESELFVVNHKAQLKTIKSVIV